MDDRDVRRVFRQPAPIAALEVVPGERVAGQRGTGGAVQCGGDPLRSGGGGERAAGVPEHQQNAALRLRRGLKGPEAQIEPPGIHRHDALGKGLVVPGLQGIVGDLHHREGVKLRTGCCHTDGEQRSSPAFPRRRAA